MRAFNRRKKPKMKRANKLHWLLQELWELNGESVLVYGFDSEELGKLLVQNKKSGMNLEIEHTPIESAFSQGFRLIGKRMKKEKKRKRGRKCSR